MPRKFRHSYSLVPGSANMAALSASSSFEKILLPEAAQHDLKKSKRTIIWENRKVSLVSIHPVYDDECPRAEPCSRCPMLSASSCACSFTFAHSSLDTSTPSADLSSTTPPSSKSLAKNSMAKKRLGFICSRESASFLALELSSPIASNGGCLSASWVEFDWLNVAS